MHKCIDSGWTKQAASNEITLLAERIIKMHT